MAVFGLGESAPLFHQPTDPGIGAAAVAVCVADKPSAQFFSARIDRVWHTPAAAVRVGEMQLSRTRQNSDLRHPRSLFSKRQFFLSSSEPTAIPEKGGKTVFPSNLQNGDPTLNTTETSEGTLQSRTHQSHQPTLEQRSELREHPHQVRRYSDLSLTKLEI
jgi:hypothetical protein